MIIELYEAKSSYYIADVNTRICCINTMDNIKRSSSYSLKDIVKRSEMPCENIPPPEFAFLGDENLNDNTYMTFGHFASCLHPLL